MEDICGIYCIENKVNGKKYIGQSIEIEQRWKNHRRLLKGNKHSNTHLQSAWNKYREMSFTFSILEVLPRELLNEREIYWINFYKTTGINNGYNMDNGGIGAGNGKYNPFYGKKHTEETKQKISKANTGIKRTEAEKQHLREVFTGRVVSDETRAKHSILSKGRKMTDQAKQKMRDAKIGKYVGEKHPRNKYSEDTIVQVIDLLLKGTMQKEIHELTGVSLGMIGNIKRKSVWKYLTEKVDFNLGEKNAS